MAGGSIRGAVMITGASSGIGRACAEHLDALGFTVLAGVRKDSDADALRSARSQRIHPVLLDVTDAEAVAAAAGTVEEVARGRLAGLVNNAGIGVGGPVELITTDEWRRQLEVNLIGAVAVTQAVLPALRGARGRIVNITSIGGRLATPFLGPYSASKFALEAVTDVLRQELRQFGVDVAAVEPGAVATAIWEKGRASAEELTATLPADGLELYNSGVQALRKAISDAERASVPPEDVAKVVAHALTARRPRTRYVVGRDARTRLAISRVLPTRAMDRLVARVMGL
jgi:NAD(P)-dependent dehydrogenase (short-subunit alcohol dehydrogenase family)